MSSSLSVKFAEPTTTVPAGPPALPPASGLPDPHAVTTVTSTVMITAASRVTSSYPPLRQLQPTALPPAPPAGRAQPAARPAPGPTRQPPGHWPPPADSPLS